MKLAEMFDDVETSLGDFIITKFELGKITYDEARQELIDNGLEVYMQELNMADELMHDGEPSIHDIPPSMSIN